MSIGAAAPQRRRLLVVDIGAAGSMVGRVLRWLSLTLIVPIGVALLYGETVVPFLVPLVGGFLVGGALEWVCGRRSDQIRGREAFAVVAITWLFAALLGSVPYIIEGGDISAPIDAYFEAMSGFTTTGSSVISDLQTHNQSLLFWRSMTQWLGGMGIIVLALAVLGRTGPGGKALLEREAPGADTDKLTPRLRDTALHLWLVYVGISCAMVLILYFVGLVDDDHGMNFYNAVVHSFTTVSTGGFSPEPRSLEAFGWVAQLIIVVFMVIGGANFALWYRMLHGERLAAVRDGEFRVYLGLLAVASSLIAIALIATTEMGVLSSFGQATFQAVSIMTGTGFASQNFAVWTAFALLILFLAMFVGGCAGSTTGAIKVVRIRLAVGGMRRDLETAVHPEAVLPVRVTGKPVRESAIQGATVFAGIYLATFVVGAILILLICTFRGYNIDAFTAMVTAATTLGNVGPGVTPMASFAPYPWESKLVMILLMWLGRLEIISIFVLFTRSYWLR